MEGLWGLQGVMREEYSRDLTNLNLMGRGWEKGLERWWNVYNLLNNFIGRCGIMGMGRKEYRLERGGLDF